MNKNIFVVNHPLIQDKLSILRDKKTSSTIFRQNIHEISLLLIAEATRNLPITTKTIETPLESTHVDVLMEREPLVVPIMRAGIGMLNAFLTLFPIAKVGFIGLRRNETTFVSEQYYLNIPKDAARHSVFVIDPMLATGGSVIACVTRLKSLGIEDIRVINIIAAPEGLSNFQDKFPEVPIYVGVIDRTLNQQNFIVPGLGDAGDRLYGTGILSLSLES